ncbi:radical SAM enzyme, TIGR01210 family [Alkalithermobacter thermoalcaliphilus JW-YL-7 = DSM 7308]|uniref:Radical SAM domain protein n=1 Tax=Alkalithermobacter thermoalcaliphilus JW-YL-7 = DSM 7308 TaxID=1121328 RepID=A0A150FR50_CLOPD|nr:Radical SAM domain protein [[Clostridium] paradoxum JW-YL-7 = DSM 7308]SHL00434.1 radical SAM enzyme, TIGR01210 family [[Clostridium] paradoxum JW-YL-7 = DSM 7308]
MTRKIIPIFVPHRGCPHDCIFCNQKKITGVSTDITSEKVRNIINEYLKTIKKDAHIEIAFFGGSFTAIDINIQESLLSVAKEYIDKQIVKDIRLSTRPDCIDENILNMLKKNGVTIIELGVQSLSEDVLDESLRGHTSKDVIKSSQLIKQWGFKLGLQMMVGLPKDTQEKCIYTAKEFIKLKPDFVRIYPTLIVKDTGLEKLYKEGRYTPFDMEKTIDIVKKLLVLFYTNNINVIRVGLQTTENISLGKEILNGPYHPALRELVESRLYRDYIEHLINRYDLKDNILIYTDKTNISKIIGNKKENVIYIYDKYKIKIKTKEDLLESSIKIETGKKSITTTLKNIYKDLYYIYNL